MTNGPCNGVTNAVCNAVTHGVALRVRCCVQNQNQNQSLCYVCLSSVVATVHCIQTATRENDAMPEPTC